MPEQQIDFAFSLKNIRSLYLQNALLETVREMDIVELDRELANFISNEDLAKLAQHGMRAELMFAVPSVLKTNPYLLGYYRLLMGFSQKEFYGNDKGYGIGIFKSMEINGKLSANAESKLHSLCESFCLAASRLLSGIYSLNVSRELLDDLTLLTIGPQLRGGANNTRGTKGIVSVFEIIKEIVGHSIMNLSETAMQIKSATGRPFLIEFAPDPDIIILEEMDQNHFRNVVAIEVKSGTDVSNIHNRIGEAEKSHQKARQQGFTECWTVINVAKLDLKKAKGESPSTDRFYSLSELQLRSGDEYEDFRRRILSLTAIPAVKK